CDARWFPAVRLPGRYPFRSDDRAPHPPPPSLSLYGHPDAAGSTLRFGLLRRHPPARRFAGTLPAPAPADRAQQKFYADVTPWHWRLPYLPLSDGSLRAPCRTAPNRLPAY